MLDEDQFVFAEDQIMSEDISFIANEPKKARFKHYYSTIWKTGRNLKSDCSFLFIVSSLLIYWVWIYCKNIRELNDKRLLPESFIEEIVLKKALEHGKSF